MEFQTNPYLIWQLIPGFVTLGIGLYALTRPLKKRGANEFAVLMFGGSFWAFANAIQLATPDERWQRLWYSLTYLGIMAVPTAWFLLSVQLTGYGRRRIERFERWLWGIPIAFYLVLLTNDYHRLFLASSAMVNLVTYISLVPEFGPLFYLHTAYSYLILITGIAMLAVSLITNYRRYGSQAYGLILGVLAPLVGNAYFLFGSPPPDFPDPTPMIFSVTGVAFAWAIFRGRLLEVVPLARDFIVRKLSTGIVILDVEQKIQDINPAAITLLGLPHQSYHRQSFPGLVRNQPDLATNLLPHLTSAAGQAREAQVRLSAGDRTLDGLVSIIEDRRGESTGWLIQLTDISEQEQAEAELATTRETLESVLDTLPDGYFEADPTGIITYANLAFCQSVGRPLSELVGANFRHFVIRKSIRLLYQKFNQVIETKSPQPAFRFDYRSRDGQLYIAEATVSPILEGEVVVGTRGVLRDITARVKAEEEIADQKDLLDSVLQQSPIAMVINDQDKKVSVVNPAFEKMFGYSRAEAVGHSLDDLLALPGAAGEGKDLSTLIMKRPTSRLGQRRRKDGSVVDVEMFAAPFSVGGEPYGYLAFYTDISERLKAEAEREKTRLTYREMLDSLQDSYFEADAAGVLTYVNEAFARAVGLNHKEELIGKHFRHVAARGHVRPVYENFKRLYETNAAIDPFEFVYRTPDGIEFTSEMVVSPILEDGRAIGTRGTVRDISVRVKAEEVLRQAKEAAEFRAGELAVINRVAATVSRSLDLHDILQSVCEELTTAFAVRNAGIGLLTPDRQGLEIIAFHAVNPGEKSARGMILPLEGNQASHEVITLKKTVVIQDSQTDPRTVAVADISRARGTRSIMIVPLLARGEAIGTIGLPARDPDYHFSAREIELAETIASQIAAAVDNAKLHARTEQALGVAERDLEIGRQIQSGFFPEKLPVIPGWEIAAHFDAARQVAGDFYDIFQFRNSAFTAFIIADVCDKGVGAALFMVLVRSLLRAFSETRLDGTNVEAQLAEIVTNTSDFIARYHGKSNMFATLFYGILDPEAGLLYYVNGGHEPPIIVDRYGGIRNRLMPTGPAVGLFPGMSFGVEQIQFEAGASLVAFTDGATDAKDMAGQLFTEERLLRAVGHPWSSIFSLIVELNTALKQHIGEQTQFDDITLVAFRRQCDATPVRHAICRPARLEVLGELRGFVEAAAHYSGLAAEDVFAFKLVVDELCTNIIQYGYAGRAPGVLALTFEVDGAWARLFIHDDGMHFAPDAAATPDLTADWEERQLGGLGLYFVQELMDKVAYTRTAANFNEIRLEKTLTAPNLKKE